MPPELAGLIEAERLLQGLVKVEGSCFLEVFCGEGAVTLGVTFNKVPAIVPWDSAYGHSFDVLSCGDVIFCLIRHGLVGQMHFGTPCQSMTFARLPQLRNRVHPWGLPGLKPHQQELVSIGNRLTVWTVQVCLALWLADAYFSVENPERSWIWTLDLVRDLYQLRGVAAVVFQFATYLAPCRKDTVILHNTPTLHRLWGPVPEEAPAPVPLRGTVVVHGRKIFKTKLMQAYPPLLGLAYGGLTREAIALRDAAVSAGAPVPMAIADEDVGLPFLQVPGCEFSRVPGGDNGSNDADDIEDDMVAADPDEPFVRNGGGAPKGLSHREHVAWALSQEHPQKYLKTDIAPELSAAVEFEITTNPTDIDEFRSGVVHRWLAAARELEQVRAAWVQQAAPVVRPLAQRFHLPFVQWLIEDIGHADTSLATRLQHGFQYVGVLDKSYVGVKNSAPIREEYTVQQLRGDRQELNDLVTGKLKELPFSDDAHAAALEDAGEGFMSVPQPLENLSMEEASVSRRLPVRETRVKNGEFVERTRIVDHKSESNINMATAPQETLEHDTIDALVWISLKLMAADLVPVLWKRDLRKAFRGCPIQAEDLDLTWVAWIHEGVRWVARHLGMPFGTTSAVYAFHRVGALLSSGVRRSAKAPLARYVDDFFGASRSGVYWTGGRLLKILASIIGRPCDDDKSVDDKNAMVVLGIKAEVDFANKVIQTAVEEAKAQAWSIQLTQVVERGFLDPGLSSKYAGRLSFAVTAAADRCGRAYIRPLYAQAAQPMAYHRCSGWLMQALTWWVDYLVLRPAARRGVNEDRPTVISWTDASGVEGWIAAVVWADGVFHFTRCLLPQHVWDQLLERGDHQIGFQEAAAVLLCQFTFPDLLDGALWLSFVDNDGVMGGFIKGASRQPETNLMMGKFWLRAAARKQAVNFWRVESKANIADGPTRHDLELLQELGAQEREPVWPDWFFDLWAPPSI